jgi:prolyl-tRNA synthetase
MMQEVVEKQSKQQKSKQQKGKQQKGKGGNSNKGLTPREEDFSKWYLDVIAAADLVDQSPVKGCMVIKPQGMSLWEAIRDDLDKRIKATGAQNAYFPLFIPISFFSKEAEHVEGFAKECAVVTHHRLRNKPDGQGVEPDPDAELEEQLIVRPTSETMIWHMFKRWIGSYRELPLKVNQWANVVRWELRTRPFLRSSEFLWQEGHTAHETEAEADATAREMLDVYADLCSSLLAVPVVKGRKSPTERFAGAEDTYTIEALMQNGWALQSGTSHFLGQNFAKAFDVRFQTSTDNKQELVWATSWGVSTRLLGALVMTHSDDQGLVLPPAVAPVQVMLVPISKGPDKAPEEHAKVMNVMNKAVDQLKAAGIRAQIDTHWKSKMGARMYDLEKKGVPLRVECGPRDVDAGNMLAKRRTGGDKFSLPIDDSLASTISAELEAMQKQLLTAATERMQAKTFEVASYEEMKQALEGSNGSSAPGFFLVPWHDDAEAEAKVKEETKATIRCFPFDAQHRAEGQNCFMTGRPATHMALFARAY